MLVPTKLKKLVRTCWYQHGRMLVPTWKDVGTNQVEKVGTNMLVPTWYHVGTNQHLYKVVLLSITISTIEAVLGRGTLFIQLMEKQTRL